MSFSWVPNNMVLLLLVQVLIISASVVTVKSNVCDFPAIYNFGNSNSDTGSDSAAFGRLQPPYGETFFGEPSGRYSDGRLILDFLAEELGLPYLSAFLDSLGTSYTHGANFASSGATIADATGRMIDAGISPLYLQRQLSQFDQFKTRTTEMYGQGKTDGIPRTQDFSKALYTFDMGQNDISYGLTISTVDEVLESIPDLINQTSLAIQNLYEHGARVFRIHNTGPIGCLPLYVANFPQPPENTDEIGCIKSFNEVCQEFNKQLKTLLSQFREKLQDAAFTYVDIYTVKYSLIKNATSLGFVDPLGYCLKPSNNPAGLKDVPSCENPDEYINWDGIHYTEAANHWVASQILDGSFSDPPLPISEACQKVSTYGRDEI